MFIRVRLKPDVWSLVVYGCFSAVLIIWMVTFSVGQESDKARVFVTILGLSAFLCSVWWNTGTKKALCFQCIVHEIFPVVACGFAGTIMNWGSPYVVLIVATTVLLSGVLFYSFVREFNHVGG